MSLLLLLHGAPSGGGGGGGGGAPAVVGPAFGTTPAHRARTIPPVPRTRPHPHRRRRRDRGIEQITWVVNGRPVKAEDWEATMVAPGGYDRFSARVPRRELKNVDARQGARVIGHRPGGTKIWEGRLVTDPDWEGASASLVAAGNKVRADRSVRRRLFQHRDYGEWTPIDSDPFGLSVDDALSAGVNRGSLKFRIEKGQDITINAKTGLALWAPGERLTRIAFHLEGSGALTNYVLRVFEADDSGSGSQAGTDITLGGLPIDIERNLTGDKNRVDIRFVRTAATGTTTQTTAVKVTDLRVNGLSDEDETTASDVVETVAEQLGLTTGHIRASGLNVLPLDWTESDTALLDHMATLVDWRWLIMGTEMKFGPWGDEWAVESTWDTEHLVPVERFNRVRVTFTSKNGVPKFHEINAAPDPLREFGITNPFTFDIGGPHPNDNLAEAVAAALMAKLSAPQVRGSITFTEARRAGRRGDPGSPYRVQAGDRLVLRGRPGLPAQRIVGITYRPDGVEAQLGQDVSVARLLARRELVAARR